MFQDHAGESFYRFAMALFMDAGHVFTSTPEYYNHSTAQFVYFDNKPDILLSPLDRARLTEFNNISRLFTVNGCVFFSINLTPDVRWSDRSETAHYIHTLIYPIIEEEGTICIFRHGEEVMLSFMGYGYHCILSDWYPMFDPYDKLLQRLDIINMRIDNNRVYFDDMVYTLARPYYTLNQNTSPLSILPIDCLTKLEQEEISREDIDEMIREGMPAYKKYYGDDYIEYDETAPKKSYNITSSLDLMLLEMEMEDGHHNDLEDSDSDDEGGSTYEDKYEFDDIDPEVFRDPTLLVKLLEKQNRNDEPMPGKTSSAKSLLESIKAEGLQYKDNRESGGCLWVFGDMSISETIHRLEQVYKIQFYFKKDGPRRTNQPAWLTTDNEKSQ